MKWVSIWTSIKFGIDLAFIIQLSLKSGINYQALVVLGHSLILRKIIEEVGLSRKSGFHIWSLHKNVMPRYKILGQ